MALRIHTQRSMGPQNEQFTSEALASDHLGAADRAGALR